MLKNLSKFLLLFLTGYCVYIAIEVSFRGYSYVLMGLVGGICVLLINPINDHISWDMPLVLQMSVSAIIISVLEVIAGKFALHILDVRMWDYSNMWGNAFEALFCPLFAVAWFFLSGVAIVLCDAINYYVLHEEIRPYYRLWNWNGKKHFLPERMCKNE